MKESDLKVLIKEVLNELENPPGAGLEEHNYGMFTIADPALEAKVKKAILVYAKQARQLEVAHLKNLTALLAGLGAGDFYSQMRAYDRKQKVPQGITRKVKSVAKISHDETDPGGSAVHVNFTDGSGGQIFFED